MVWRLMRGLIDSFAELVGTASRVKPTTSVPPRGPARVGVDHVILLDGTMGSLHPSRITSIGLIHHLLRGAASRSSVYYGKGLEWREWAEISEVVMAGASSGRSAAPMAGSRRIIARETGSSSLAIRAEPSPPDHWRDSLIGWGWCARSMRWSAISASRGAIMSAAIPPPRRSARNFAIRKPLSRWSGCLIRCAAWA